MAQQQDVYRTWRDNFKGGNLGGNPKVACGLCSTLGVSYGMFTCHTLHCLLHRSPLGSRRCSTVISHQWIWQQQQQQQQESSATRCTAVLLCSWCHATMCGWSHGWCSKYIYQIDRWWLVGCSIHASTSGHICGSRRTSLSQRSTCSNQTTCALQTASCTPNPHQATNSPRPVDNKGHARFEPGFLTLECV